MSEGPELRVEVSAGELIDKITILEIKAERIADPDKLANVARELASLVATRDAAVPADAALDELADALREVNESLWVVEDDLRACEARGEFGPAFVALARSVYRLNDRRAALKREVNRLTGSRLTEEKFHPDY